MSFQFLSRGLSRQVFNTTRWAPQQQVFQPAFRIPTVTTTAVRTFASKKHKNLLKHTKGFRGRSKNCFRVAVRRVQKSWQYAFRDRRRKKREWHKIWIQRIQAGVRQYSWRYSEFFGAYRKSGLQMDRKVLAELAATEPFAFRSVVQVVEHQSAIPK
eukprot:Nitzschia sp. Nitz4//scaffold13_size275219//100084//100661//NITZ4_000864-RA/size275219-augustus-gene-0.230-mRNA-1//1//CDS//3329535984//7710//frame0